MDVTPETPGRLEPCLLEEANAEILDLVAALSLKSATLGSRLHPKSAAALADAVRIMNCYYSNLIEGHNTTPRDIEKALADELDTREERRNLQLEARAHIRVQEMIDRQHAEGNLPEPASENFIKNLHQKFYEDAPEAVLRIEANNVCVRMTPGQFRVDGDPDVRVGRHLPPSAKIVESCMAHFAWRYRFNDLGVGAQIMAMAAAHHRLNYIHPFLDGNGRVSRLMSHAMALKAGIGAHGLWSVSRGLARRLDGQNDYKSMMDYADTPRQGDLDGRGNLSQKALADFTAWFLKICLDQVTFMGDMFALDTLRDRLQLYVARKELRPEALLLLQQTLQRGELPRGEASLITGLGERTARELLGDLVGNGILGSETPKSPVSLRFPLTAIEILFPALFPEA